MCQPLVNEVIAQMLSSSLRFVIEKAWLK
jgi:hypothetical protein